MKTKYKLRTEYVLVDWLTATMAFVVFNVYRFHSLVVPTGWGGDVVRYLTSSKLIGEEVVFPLGMLGVYWLSGYYHDPFQRSRLQELLVTLVSSVVNMFLIYLTLLTNDQISLSSRNYALLGVLLGLLFAFTYTGRFIVTGRRIRMIRQKRWKFSTMIVGTRAKALEVTAQLRESLANLGYSPEGYVITDGEGLGEFEGKPVYTSEDIGRVCRERKITQVILALPRISDGKLLEILREFFMLNIPVKISPDLRDYLTSGIVLHDIYGEPFVDITSPGLAPSTANIKRTFDVIASAIALVLLIIPSIVIALRIHTDSKGPILYRQTRIGRHGRPFTIYKFRTMRTDAEAAGPSLSSDEDPRITRCGRVLRKYRLDELPQFWNVLIGDMSLVGPRPERDFYIRQIVKKAPYYTLLHRVRPGITSWGMVKYGYASDVDQMIERVKYDLLYLTNMSITIDLKILIYTVRTVVLGKGK